MSELYRQTTANQVQRDEADPCTCTSKEYGRTLCAWCQYEHDVDWYGGHTALALHKQEQELRDAGLDFLC